MKDGPVKIIIAVVVCFAVLLIAGMLLKGSEESGDLLSDSSDTYNCPPGIVPENFYLSDNLKTIQREMDGAEVYFHEEYVGKMNWSDGQPLFLRTRDFKDACYWGKHEGENISLVYCKGLDYSKTEEVISEDGIVGGTSSTNYLVDIVLEKKSTAVLNEVSKTSRKPKYNLTTFRVLSSNCIEG